MPSSAPRSKRANSTRSTLGKLLRFIDRSTLKAGDTLPKQSDLRLQLGLHNDGLNAAMEVLTANGMVRRRQRSGTVLLDPTRSVRGVWRVGLAVFPATATHSYYGQLLHLIQSELTRRGIGMSHYMLSSEIDVSDSRFDLTNFDHLIDDIKNQAIDAVLSFASLSREDWSLEARSKLPVVHVGSWESAPCGAVIDQRQLVKDSYELLYHLGCRRIAVITSEGHHETRHRFWDEFCHVASQHGLTVGESENLHGGSGPVGGCRVAEQLYALPADQRPDGLIITDDAIASGLTAVLSIRSGYRPRMAVQTNRQVPIAYSLPVFHFELDATLLAAQAVDMIATRLLRPNTPHECRWVAPHLASPFETILPTEVLESADFAGTRSPVSLVA